MGSYLNPGSERFRTSIRSEIYVDKTLLIAQVNLLLVGINYDKEKKHTCVIEKWQCE